MSPRTRPFVLFASLLFLGLVPTSLRAEIEFNGLIALKDGALFSLADPAAGTRSGWIALQQEFAGFKLTAYDPKGDVLVLAKDGVKTELRLNAAKVRPAVMEVQGTINLSAGGKIEVERATLLFDQDNTFPLRDGIVLHVTPTRLPDGTLQFVAAFLRPRADGTAEAVAGPMAIRTLPDKAASIQIGSRDNPADSLGFSFTPTQPDSAAGAAPAAPAAAPRETRPLQPATK